MPEEVTKKFIELAGGPEALIVVLPIAGEPITHCTAIAGGGEGRILRAGRREERQVAAGPHARRSRIARVRLRRSKEAKGVWFGGGRQWRFVDAYVGTQGRRAVSRCAPPRRRDRRLQRGASIQAQYMPRGSPLGNTDMMAEGYERGLGFLPGAAVDQHFSAAQAAAAT